MGPATIYINIGIYYQIAMTPSLRFNIIKKLLIGRLINLISCLSDFNVIISMFFLGGPSTAAYCCIFRKHVSIPLNVFL